MAIFLHNVPILTISSTSTIGMPSSSALNGSSHKVSVVLIDRYVAVRQLVSLLLPQMGPFTVVGEASTAEEGFDIFHHVIPDLVILDLQLPETSGLSILQHLRTAHHNVRVLIFTAVENPVVLAAALGEKSDGYVSKLGSIDELRVAVDTVSRGGVYWAPQAREVLEQTSENGFLGRQNLCERDLILLTMIAHGLSSKEIATRLTISSKTVDNQRLKLMRKLRIKNANGLTRYALQQGLIAQS